MKIIITIVVALFGLGGGAYYAQDSGLYDFKQLKQYIPSQVQELLNIEETQTVSISSDEMEDVGAPSFDDSQEQDDSFNNQSMDDTEYQQAVLDDAEYRNTLAANTVTEAVDDSGRDDRMKLNVAQNAQEVTLLANAVPVEEAHTSAVATPVKADVKVLDASPEEMQMVKELNKIESNIVKLDNENEDLQLKYNKMIKKNRELALKIREIDHKIKAIDSQ